MACTGPTVVQSLLQCTPADMKHENQSSVQDDKSQRSGRRSEADSEEANQDVSALSQEGSLGSFSDSSFKLRMAAAAESVPAHSIMILTPPCKLTLASSGNCPAFLRCP